MARMNPALHTYIVFRLGQLEISQTAIAALAGVSAPLVNQVITGRKGSEKVQAVLMHILGFRSWDKLVSEAYRFQAYVAAMPKREA